MYLSLKRTLIFYGYTLARPSGNFTQPAARFTRPTHIPGEDVRPRRASRGKPGLLKADFTDSVGTFVAQVKVLGLLLRINRKVKIAAHRLACLTERQFLRLQCRDQRRAGFFRLLGLRIFSGNRSLFWRLVAVLFPLSSAQPRYARGHARTCVTGPCRAGIGKHEHGGTGDEVRGIRRGVLVIPLGTEQEI